METAFEIDTRGYYNYLNPKDGYIRVKQVIIVSKYMDKIDSYGIDLEYIGEASDFELIGTLVKRDELEEIYDQLSVKEKLKLQEYDEILINNFDKFYESIKNVYSFQNIKPESKWWSYISLLVNQKYKLSAI